jgi:hypothetical protein
MTSYERRILQRERLRTRRAKEKARREARARATKEWRARRVLAGGCISCAAPAAPDRSRCAPCLEKARLKKQARPLPAEEGC